MRDELGSKKMTVTFQHQDAGLATPVPSGMKETQKHANGIYARYFKRLLDVSIVTLSLPIVAPIFIMAALANLASGNPILYSQLRLGRNGKVFRIWKMSSMYPNAEKRLEDLLQKDHRRQEEWVTTQKLKNDPRVTPVGTFLRKTSIDEIPQLFNVLKGDMSLLGPRPMMLSQAELYGPSLPVYLELRPGISGKWQVSERNDAHFQRRAQIDAEYARDLGFLSDLKLIWLTFRTLLRSTGY